ncbi:MAG TPA: aspartate kinase [Polyangiaceae bacterium]|nr:aspartate kinase [Polyangiaceae bacterium]
MTRIAAKFGGTSCADSSQIRKVKAILDSDARRQVVVVSAPGKRVKTEAKVTDLLYLCAEMASMSTDFSAPFSTVRERFVGIERELGVDAGVGRALDAFAEELKSGVTADYVASRGEYFNALIIAEFLGAEFVDPTLTVFIQANGIVDPKSYTLLGERLADTSKRYVIPGFYGQGPDGRVKTFSRGGSDISGAIAARAISASVYENWTDVSGLLMTDPRIVESPEPMVEVTYRELRELSYMGASVLHDEATLPVREVGIPIHIKNTNEPTHAGTRIVPSLSDEEYKATAIAGIAGKERFSMVCVEKSLMNKEVGFAYRLLGIFQRRGISVEHMPSSIDGINVIVEQDQIEGQTDDVLAEIRGALSPDKVTLVPDLALIAVVGEGMNHAVGISARVFASLGRAGVNVRVINQGASEVNIIVGVVPADFKKAVQALYGEFIETQRRSVRPPSN